MSRLKAAIQSHSLPELIEVVTGVANDVLPRFDMPRFAESVSHFSVFLEDAKAVRTRKIDAEIGRTLQHEILAERWKSLMGDDVGKVLLEEIENAFKARKDKSVANVGMGHQEKDDGNLNVDAGVKKDEDKGGMMFDDDVKLPLERWFSWGCTARGWDYSDANDDD